MQIHHKDNSHSGNSHQSKSEPQPLCAAALFFLERIFEAAFHLLGIFANRIKTLGKATCHTPAKRIHLSRFTAIIALCGRDLDNFFCV